MMVILSVVVFLEQTAKHGINLNIWGIKNNGTDATATTEGINNALQWASENGFNEVHLQAGTYLIDSVNWNETNPAHRNKDAGIIIPSGITLTMTPKTILKVEPNNSASYSAISLSKFQNDIRIIGGQIWGDRKEHDYTGDPTRPTHEWCYGILLNGCSNVLIEGVKIKDCTGDSIMAKSPGLINYDENNPYVPASRIRINNCVLDSARRNNISLQGCDHVIVENCQILNAGINDGIKDGTLPMFGIDIEGYRENDIDYEIPVKIVIRNNKFEGNVNLSVENFNGYEVVIDGNFSDNSLSYGNGTDTVIANNVLKRTGYTNSGIRSNRISSNQTGNHATVVGNTIQGFEEGMSIRGGNVTVSGNTINDVATGISLYRANQMLIVGNTITKCSRDGIRFLETDKTTVIGNSIREVADRVFNISFLNNLLTIQNNMVEQYNMGVFSDSGDIIVKGNNFNQGSTVSAACMTIKSNVKALIEGNKIIHNDYNVILVNAGDNTGTVSIIRNEITNNNTMLNLTVLAKYEVIGNLFKSNISSSSLANAFSALLLGSNVSGAEILDNTFKALNEFPYTKPIHTLSGTNSKIIKNVTLNGGSINKNETDLLEGNLLFV